MERDVANAVEEREQVIVRFAGDSGDGMQLVGSRFTDATAVLGNDLATLPSFPAEIRAPAGTLAGVSAFQINFASSDVLTPGDAPNVLVAMNPAALKANRDAYKQKDLGRPEGARSMAAFRAHGVGGWLVVDRLVDKPATSAWL
jgi:Pyruvate ferredoxin/flavodoxin oxidoreductase